MISVEEQQGQLCSSSVGQKVFKDNQSIVTEKPIMSVSGPFSGILFRLFQSTMLASMQLIFEAIICKLTNNKNQCFHLMFSFHVMEAQISLLTD